MNPDEPDGSTTESREPPIASKPTDVLAHLIQDWFKKHLNLKSEESQLDLKGKASVETGGWNPIDFGSSIKQDEAEQDATPEGPSPTPRLGPAPEPRDETAPKIGAARIPFELVSRSDVMEQVRTSAEEPTRASRSASSEIPIPATTGTQPPGFVAAVPRSSSHLNNTDELATISEISILSNRLNEPKEDPARVRSLPIGEGVAPIPKGFVSTDSSFSSDDPTLRMFERNEPSAFIAVSRRRANEASWIEPTTPALAPPEANSGFVGPSSNAGSTVAESSGNDLEQSIERLLSVLDQVLRGERACLATGRRRYPLN